MAVAEHGLSLGELLDQEELGLRLLVGDERCHERPVAGVHGTEIENPSRWLDPGWVMLTTGMRLGGREREQRRLVAELDEAGLTALGFGVEMVHEEVLDGIVEEARERGFPLFEVPFQTAFSTVSAFAAGSVLSQDFHVLRRINSMREHLMSALDEPEPERELVARLAKMLDSTVVLHRPDGRLREHAGPGEGTRRPAPAWTNRVWEEVCRREPDLQCFRYDDLKVVSAPIEAEGRLRSWLLAVTRQSYTFEHLTRPMVESTVRLLALVATARRIRSEEERAHLRELIEALGAGEAASAADLPRRLAASGLDFSSPARAFAVGLRAQHEGDGLGELSLGLEHLFASAHLPLALAEGEDQVACLTQAEAPALEHMIEAFTAGAEGVLVGIGRPARSAAELGRSLGDAGLALEQLQGQKEREVLRFEDLELISWLMTHAESGAVEAKVRETLGELKAKPQLYETLRCYLRLDLDVVAAAKALNLHANSLRYRLSKIEEIVGSSLRKPATISNLYLAITLDSIGPEVAPHV